MLGAIIGDIVGSRFEFNPTNDYDFELFTDECSFTDDTICTIAVADALLKGIDYGKSIHTWCRRYPKPMGGYGISFRKWVMSDNPQPYNSYGNGAAMRVSPIGMWFDDWKEIYPEAEKCAACSHNHPEGIKGAQIIAYAIHNAVVSFDCPLPPDKFKDELIELVVAALCDGDYDTEINLEDYRNKFDETCQGTVPVAIEIIFNSDSFEDAIRRAVSLGADADTLGAIVGSIAEHIWGIPDWIKEKALSYLPDEMLQVVDAFYTACESRETYKPRAKQAKAEENEAPNIDEVMAIMHWKLGLGNLNNLLSGRDLIPEKTKKATARDRDIHPMPDDLENTTDMPFYMELSARQMIILRMGHIPEGMEDHWFMYCDDEYIRYYRSWTGMCAFEAHYRACDRGFMIDRLKMNHDLAQFGVNGDEAGKALFEYLMIAETGGDAASAWENYRAAWLALHHKYKK